MMKFICLALLFLFLRSECVDSNYVNCFDDYDYTYDYPEVIILPPEKINNIIEFLKRLSTSPKPIAPFPTNKDIEETTKYREEITTTISTEKTTTTVSTETTTVIPIQETTQFREREDENQVIEDPVEDIDMMNENVKVSTPAPNLESSDYDNEYERDSEEDLLSSKKKAEITSKTTDDENNSKPENINTWFKL